MTTRRRWLSSCGAAALGVGFAAHLRAADEPSDDDPEKSAAAAITPEAAAAIERGLAYLAGRQNADDGSFGAGGYARNVAVCGLAGMAFLAGGSTPGRGPYGQQVDRCLDFVLASTQDQGFITVPAASSHGPMYGHGFATLFLAECYGMSLRDDLREKLAAAVKLIVDSQNGEGGWRYQPQPRDADLSVTVAQLMALRAARNAGIKVPKETIDRAIDYVKKAQNADGGFTYQLYPRGPSLFPRSAAGVVALYTAGAFDAPEIGKGLDYLMNFLPRGNDYSRESHYFYGHYYAVQAMWHAGGERWSRWYPAIRDALVARQGNDGSWADSICPEYGTAMAAIILQIPNNLLPIFQR